MGTATTWKHKNRLAWTRDVLHSTVHSTQKLTLVLKEKSRPDLEAHLQWKENRANTHGHTNRLKSFSAEGREQNFETVPTVNLKHWKGRRGGGV